MSLITAHDNKTEITGLTKDNSYHTVDLSSYVQSGCVGVLLQFTNALDGGRGAGYRSTGAATTKDFSILNLSYNIIAAKLDESYQADLKCQDSNVDVYIMAEFFEGFVLRDTDNWIEHQPQAGSWQTVALSPLGDDAFADIEAVIVYGKKTGGTQEFGVRPLGSTVDSIFLTQNHIFALPVKINENGQFQLYIPSGGCAGPTVWGVEIGYILKGYDFTAVFEPEDLAPDTNNDWGSLDLSGVVEQYTSHAFIRTISTTAGGFDCSLRAVGSTNDADSIRRAVWQVFCPSVDSNLEVEYRKESGADIVFDVWGYLVGEPPPEPPEPEPTDGIATVSNRYVTSLGPIMLEILNLTEVLDEDIVVSQIQDPRFAVGIRYSDGAVITESINADISGRVITINCADFVDGDDDLVLLVFGF